ncbi:MAG: phosphoribosylformylglycinamidine synthase subunit PurQ, partial [Anaerovoracaceae bacterium]
REALDLFLNEKDGLMLGICNGFQALIKLGLLPYGEIREAKVNSPTLTFNTIGRHQSTMIRTKINSKLSPWLDLADENKVYTNAISHGEGRFICEDKIYQELSAKGQIATKYVSLNGDLGETIAINPNGSIHNVEGITSADGRIFGKMAHSERIGHCLYKNIPAEYDQRIFESGINYFK